MIASLTAENLALRRGDRLLFDGLSFRVTTGQTLALEGANGAGKTSLLRLIAGFLSPHAGRLVMETQSGAVTDAEERAQWIGWLGHLDGLKPQLTVSEQLTFYARLYRSVSDLAAVLEDVGLKRQAELPCRYLSAGQKRRLALGRLVVSGRPLWLLDEPFSALDINGQDLVSRLMAMHCAAGGVVIAATHDPLGAHATSLRL